MSVVARRRPSSCSSFVVVRRRSLSLVVFFHAALFVCLLRSLAKSVVPNSSHGHHVVRRQNAVATRVVLATASNGHVPRGAGHEITDAKYGPGIVVEALLSVVAVLIFSCFRFAFCGRRILMIVF